MYAEIMGNSYVVMVSIVVNQAHWMLQWLQATFFPRLALKSGAIQNHIQNHTEKPYGRKWVTCFVLVLIIQARRQSRVFCFCLAIVSKITVPLRNKWTIGRVLLASAFEDRRVQIWSKCVRIRVLLLLFMLSPSGHRLLFSWRHQITTMNDLESLFASRTSWMAVNDWEKFQVVSSLAVNKLSKVVWSDDHVRDNPGGWSSRMFLCRIEIVFSRATESHVVDKLALDFAKSPDMNAIKNLWHEMKHLFRKTVKPRNIRKNLYRTFNVSVHHQTETNYRCHVLTSLKKEADGNFNPIL